MADNKVDKVADELRPATLSRAEVLRRQESGETTFALLQEIQEKAEEIFHLQAELKSKDEQIKRLYGEFKKQDAEIRQVVEMITKPFWPISCKVDSRQDIATEEHIMSFAFPSPETYCTSERVERFLQKRDFAGRDAWLRRCRWQIARYWARHAFNVFTSYAGSQSMRWEQDNIKRKPRPCVGD